MNKKRFFCVFSTLLCTLGFASLSLGAQEPKALSTDSRIKEVTYQKNNVVPIHGKTFINTQVIFGDQERIVDINGGDAAAWTVAVDKVLPNILNLKPTILGSHSNLSVVTLNDNSERHYYRFELVSNEEASEASAVNGDSRTTYVIQFIYPDEERAKLIAELNYKRMQDQTIKNASKNPKDYNWDYSFNGSKRIVPLHVFDDGKFTYLQLQDHQDVPAVFSVENAEGKESVVNYRQVDNYLVLPQVSPQFTLREGTSAVASIFNDRLIQKLQNE